jgi:hypothetical protein
MAARGEYQSNLIPAESNWQSLHFGEDQCIGAVRRAADYFENAQVIANVKERLGIDISAIPVGIGIVARIDANFQADGQPNYPAFMLFPQFAQYLNLDPDIEGVRFRWTLGVFNDSLMGPLPVLFLATRFQGVDRLAALVWSFAKERDREHFGYLLQSRLFEDMQERGSEGGLAAIYQVGFVIHGDSGGLDLLSQEYLIPWKTWQCLASSIYYNSIASEFQATAPKWPYPTDLSSDGIFSSPGSGGFKCWY